MTRKVILWLLGSVVTVVICGVAFTYWLDHDTVFAVLDPPTPDGPIAVRDHGPEVQAAIRDVREGKRLPRISQQYPIVVSGKPPYVAAYALGGPLFLVMYLGYDPVDEPSTRATRRFGAVIYGGGCAAGIRASAINRHYYLVSEAC